MLDLCRRYEIKDSVHGARRFINPQKKDMAASHKKAYQASSP